MKQILNHAKWKLASAQVIFCSVLIVSSGCGTSSIYPVSGQIVDRTGNPVVGLKGGSVEFESMDKKGGAHGAIDEKGNFTLSTESPGDGAHVGKHRVMILRPRGASPEMPSSPVVDPKYEKQETTDLFVTVEPKANTLKLEVDLAKK